MPDEPVPARLPSLTSLRFFLASAVVLCHMSYVSAIFGGSVHKALIITEALATSAVSGFFVLSGFVLTWSHQPGDRARSFWRRRFWKIFPNHLLGWTLAVAFFTLTSAAPALITETGHSTGAGAANLLLIQDWVPRGTWFFSLNTPAWSISCEAFFYALFPVVLTAARRIPVARLRQVWLLVALAILGMPLVSTLIDGPRLYDWLPINANSLWFEYVFPPVRLLEFLLGVVTARLLLTGDLSRIARRWMCVPPVAFLAVLPVLPRQYALGAGMAIPLALVIAGLALADVQGRSRRMTRPALVALGEASYALYIVHYPLLLTVRQMLGVGRTFALWPGVPIVVAMMTASVALALAVHRYYELPLMRRYARRPVPATGYAVQISRASRPRALPDEP